MIMIWRGWGFLVVVIPMVMVVTAHFAMGEAAAPPPEGGPMPASYLVALGAGGVALWFIGRALNGPAISGDDENPDGSRHDYFWVRMEYWGVLHVLVAIGLYLLTAQSGPQRTAAAPAPESQPHRTAPVIIRRR